MDESLPLVIEAEELHPEARAWLAERVRLVRCDQSDQPAFDTLLLEAEALIVRTYTKVDAALLSGAPRLRVVGRAGVGLDNIDLPACAQRGVRVVHTPGANTEAVVELVWALVFDALRPRVFLEKPLARGKWEELRTELLADRGVSERTLGVWGFGRVGSRVAAVGRALGMRVIYHDLRDIPEAERAGCMPVSRDELCDAADVLSIHVDARPENRGLLSHAELARLRPEVVLVNTSRGMVINPFALAGFMIAHPAAQALLDVHEPEPFDARYPLLDIPNVHLTPHIGAATRTAKRNMSWVAKDVWRVLDAARTADARTR